MDFHAACTDCGAEAVWGQLGTCRSCGGILSVVYPDLDLPRPKRRGGGLEAYRSILPVTRPIPFLGEGDTPLIRSRRLGPELGLKHLYFKNEGLNPSGSFKDRVAALALALAVEAGAAGVVTASSGNSASAMATHAAARGLGCVVLVEIESPAGKIRQILAMGARAVRVDGLFQRGPDAVENLLHTLAERLGYYLAFAWAPVNPYLLEGVKPLSYEIVRDLEGPPHVVVSPVGGGDLFTAQWKAYLEMQRAGWFEQAPRMIGVQSEAAPPLLTAYREGLERVPVLPAARSCVSGLNVPFSGNHALQTIWESRGMAAGAGDEDILRMQRRLAREEGIWTEPAGATPVAALGGLLAQGKIDRDERVVCILSGAGFKDLKLGATEADALVAAPPLAFDADEIAAAL